MDELELKKARWHRGHWAAVVMGLMSLLVVGAPARVKWCARKRPGY